MSTATEEHTPRDRRQGYNHSGTLPQLGMQSRM